MPKLFFKFDAVVSGQVIYKAGNVYEVSDELGSATRWIKRGAEIVAEEPKKEAKPVEIIQEQKEEAPEDKQEVVNKPSKKENKRENKSSNKV